MVCPETTFISSPNANQRLFHPYDFCRSRPLNCFFFLFDDGTTTAECRRTRCLCCQSLYPINVPTIHAHKPAVQSYIQDYVCTQFILGLHWCNPEAPNRWANDSKFVTSSHLCLFFSFYNPGPPSATKCYKTLSILVQPLLSSVLAHPGLLSSHFPLL